MTVRASSSLCRCEFGPGTGQVNWELEIEILSDETELDIEITWTHDPSGGRRRTHDPPAGFAGSADNPFGTVGARSLAGAVALLACVVCMPGRSVLGGISNRRGAWRDAATGPANVMRVGGCRIDDRGLHRH